MNTKSSFPVVLAGIGFAGLVITRLRRRIIG